MTREVSSIDEWEKLPVGTVARIETFQMERDGSETDIVVYVIRVDGDFKAVTGSYMLAGGCYWDEAWEWGEGGSITNLDAAFSESPVEVPAVALVR